MLTAILIALWVATAAQIAFVIIYGTRTPWHHGFVGRALFLKSTVLCLALVNSLVNYYWPHKYQLQVTTGLMWLLAFAVVYQCIALIERMFLDRRTVHDG